MTWESVLKRWWDPEKHFRVRVLRVGLNLAAREPRIEAELFMYPRRGGKPRSLWHGRFAPQEFGLLEGTGIPRELQVPGRLTEDVIDALARHPINWSALWLRLVPPYGHLGAVPWEQQLMERLDRPLLRVPDRLPVAAEPGMVPRAAIVVNAEPDATWAAEWIWSLARWYTRVHPEVVPHVFADVTTYEALTGGRDEAGGPAIVHNPRRAASIHRERVARGVPQFRRPAPAGAPSNYVGPALMWADWIAGELAEWSVGAVHFLASGAFDGERPLLMVSPDPGASVERASWVWMTGDDIKLLADGIGASVLSLGSPPHDSSDIAIRLLADSLGRRRSRPTLYSDTWRDPGAWALAEAQTSLALGRLPSLPEDGSLFAYVQPEHATAALRETWPDPEQPGHEWLTGRAPIGASTTSQEILPSVFEASQARPRFRRQERDLPSWLPSTERFIESKAAQLMEAAAVPGETSELKQAYDRGMAQALEELRALTNHRLEGP
ncbi:hypothetical protein [Streptomyces sp. NPDC018972]|uniref:hypothetical protein n=1 Tax=Streptomyces sp. NPDC018972 TaxID=3365060 RepID=UPI0037B29574